VTRKNILILNKLREEIGTPKRKFVVTVRAPHISRLNLAILRICLTERNERGIYISIDKPDKHIKAILERHNISKEGAYTDTGVQTTQEGISAGAMQMAKRKVLVVSGIFCPNLFLDSIDATVSADPQARATLLQELSSIKFIMIDNLGTMLAYNSWGKIQEFFSRFNVFLEQFPHMRAFMSVDKDVHGNVYNLVSQICEREIEIQDDWL
jgi:hypothetical protein